MNSEKQWNYLVKVLLASFRIKINSTYILFQLFLCIYLLITTSSKVSNPTNTTCFRFLKRISVFGLTSFPYCHVMYPSSPPTRTYPGLLRRWCPGWGVSRTQCPGPRSDWPAGQLSSRYRWSSGGGFSLLLVQGQLFKDVSFKFLI